MLNRRLDLGDGLLQVVERTTTTRTRDILRLRKLDARCLKDAVGKFHEFCFIETRIMDDELVGLLVYQQGAHSHSSLQLQRLPVLLMHIERDSVILNTSLSLFTQGSALSDGIHEFAGYGDLALRLLTQRDAHGITNALRQQGANAHSTLDTSILALTGFSDAEVQRIVHILLIHRLDEQAHSGHHHDGVRGLDADDDIIELFTLADTQELHATLNDALGRITITRHDAIGERTVIHADAHSGMMLLADIEEGHQLALDLLDFGSILLVGIFQMLERTPGIDIVARVDTYLLTVERCHIGRMSRKVHVGHQRRLIAVGLQLC